MKYPYIVNKDGVWYPAGAEVPEGSGSKSENDFSQHMNPPTEEKVYTKTEINRMSTAELKDFAKEHGVDSAEDMTGAELKKVLIEKLGL